MSTPRQGQKTIPITEWQRFARVADWFERTIEHKSPVALRPVYGDDLIVKTPAAGIDARSGTTLSSATCTICVEAETTTDGEKVLHETTDEVVVYNIYTADVGGNEYVNTTLSSSGTRYADVISGVLLVKLSAALAWDDSTGVSGTVWAGTPEAVTTRTLDEIVAIPKITTSGTFAADSFVLVQWKDGRWKVVGAPCS